MMLRRILLVGLLVTMVGVGIEALSAGAVARPSFVVRLTGSDYNGNNYLLVNGSGLHVNYSTVAGYDQCGPYYLWAAWTTDNYWTPGFKSEYVGGICATGWTNNPSNFGSYTEYENTTEDGQAGDYNGNYYWFPNPAHVSVHS